MDNYVDVATRLKWAFEKYPDLRIQETHREVIEMPDKSCFIRCTVTIWRSADDFAMCFLYSQIRVFLKCPFEPCSDIYIVIHEPAHTPHQTIASLPDRVCRVKPLSLIRPSLTSVPRVGLIVLPDMFSVVSNSSSVALCRHNDS